MWIQKEIRLKPRQRGFHLITHDIENALNDIRWPAVGLLHLFIKHTSASLTINENADPTVRAILNVISIMPFRKMHHFISTRMRAAMICQPT
ncbi:Uncharacterized conserved protein [Tatumella ptyseos]|uniref:Uncharacterized conserved protein n=1 Tax=Tatumella ptyseos TaxID=82987 RepID=A0A2X5SEK8_9GAMM|nr:Uncharacterized conserved protein [Tatumella ptyseos]